ncbi:MAG: hypothetical protein BGO98_49815 [Myxococcales bacterium 68-20]|nr:hypothetical protein [Myxococcales bacterium]OJY29911.1 MAG: hypothetical protein BGO98_49815 [Myxococcales bacterium 68-20]
MKNPFIATASCALMCVVLACGQPHEDFGGVDPAAPPPGSCDQNPNGDCYPIDDLGTNPRQGKTAGQRIRNLKFFGFKNIDPSTKTDPSGAPQRVSLSEFYDPTGTQFKVIHLIGASNWCPPCNHETEVIASSAAAKLAPRGVVFLEALIDGPTGGVGATTEVLKKWITGPRRDDSGQVFTTPLNFTVMLDPDQNALGPFFQANSVPFNLNIDARSMEILTSRQGAPPDIVADVEKWLDWTASHPAKGTNE